MPQINADLIFLRTGERLSKSYLKYYSESHPDDPLTVETDTWKRCPACQMFTIYMDKKFYCNLCGYRSMVVK